MQLSFQNVRVALYSKPGGKEIFKEYEKTNAISDVTRRKMVNILVADMVESHGQVNALAITGCGCFFYIQKSLPIKSSPTPMCTNINEIFGFWRNDTSIPFQEGPFGECADPLCTWDYNTVP